MPKMFHLGWFLNFSPPAWRSPLGGDLAREWMTGEFLVDTAKSLERAKLDMIIFEDSLMVSDIYQGSMESDLKYNRYSPKQDPLPLVATIAAHTQHIGLMATASTSFYPPYILARTFATLDHITRGRIGWNVVTSSEDRAAQNFGIDLHFEHDQRYEMADEYVDVVKQLWDSWEPDAIVADRESGVYADHTKVHPINHEGTYFKVRGPLNMMPGPQWHVPMCQAGGSPRGRDLAAKYATSILVVASNVDEMKSYREDIRGRMKLLGRNPDDCKVLFIIIPIIDETDEAAQAKLKRMSVVTDASVEVFLSHMSSVTNIDFGRFDLDQPLPADLTTNGHRSTLESFMARGTPGVTTLRELASVDQVDTITFVGSPSTVAEQMGEVMEQVGGDGFLLGSHAMGYNSVSLMTEGLVPELQRRGLTRTEYTGTTLKENLLAF